MPKAVRAGAFSLQAKMRTARTNLVAAAHSAGHTGT
jgi:hypothetical protein